MSPESASCSTRAGSGVCGGGSSSAFSSSRRPGGGRLVGVGGELVEPLLRRSAPRARALLEHRGVVGLVAHARGRSRRRPSRRPGARARPAPQRGRVLLGACLLGRRAAEHPVAERREPGRHLVDGRRGDHQHAEDGQQHEQRDHDQRLREQVDQQLGDHEAERAAGLLQGARCRRASGRGEPLAMCTMPSTPNSSAAQPIDLPAGGAVALGVAQVAPGHEDQQQRHEPAEQADRAGDDGAGQVAERRRAAATRRRRRRRRRARPGTARPRRGGAPAPAHRPSVPTRRTPAPTTCAAPSQTRATAPPRVANSR